MDAIDKKIVYFKNRILDRLEELRPYMSDTKYRLYIAMVNDCKSFDEIREMADLDLQFSMIKYIKEVEGKLSDANTNVHELEAVTNQNSRAAQLSVIKPIKKEDKTNIAVAMDIDISTLGEDMEDEEILASAANILMLRMMNTPPEELYREELENYEENEFTEEGVDNLDVDLDEMYQDIDYDDPEEDEQDEFDIDIEDEDEYTEDENKVNLSDLASAKDLLNELNSEEDDSLDFGNEQEDIIVDEADIFADSEDDIDDAFGYNSDDEDDFDIDSIDDSDLFGDDDSFDDAEDEDDFDIDSMDDSDLFGDNEEYDEEDDIESDDFDIDSIDDSDIFDDSDYIDDEDIEDDSSDDNWDSLGDDMFDNSDDSDDMDFEDDEDTVDNIDADDLFGDDSFEEDDDSEFDLDESDFEFEEPEDDFDDFFKDSASVEKPKREITVDKIFINGTDRGKQTQDMFNMLNKIFGGTEKLFNKAAKKTKQTVSNGIRNINNSGFFDIDNN